MIYLTVNLEQEDPRASEGRGTLFSVSGTGALLDLFNDLGVRATFFSSGFQAEQNPKLIERIVAGGHELGASGYRFPYAGLSKAEYREDISKCKEVLEKIAGKQLWGFRAPQQMHIPPVTEPVEKNGFLYDSTVIAGKIPRQYDHSLAPLKPYYPLRSTSFMEVPVSASLKRREPLVSSIIRMRSSRWLSSTITDLNGADHAAVISLDSWDALPEKTSGLPRSFAQNTGQKFMDLLRESLQRFPAKEFRTLVEALPKKKEKLIKIAGEN